MGIPEQEQIEQFLKTQTFTCKLQKARISHQACLIQSARAYQKKLESEKMLLQADQKSATWKKDGDSTYKLQALLHGLTGTCLRCAKFKEPTLKMLEALRIRKYIFGRLSYGKNYIPRTSPISNTLS
jgi:hypothetical protein